MVNMTNNPAYLSENSLINLTETNNHSENKPIAATKSFIEDMNSTNAGSIEIKAGIIHRNGWSLGVIPCVILYALKIVNSKNRSEITRPTYICCSIEADFKKYNGTASMT